MNIKNIISNIPSITFLQRRRGKFAPRYWKPLRSIKLFFQKWSRGWSDEDTWSLDYTIAKFTLPRLKRFKTLNNGYPGGLSEKTWNWILEDIIYSFDTVVHKWDEGFNDEDVDWERVDLGFRLFGKYFRDLWW